MLTNLKPMRKEQGLTQQRLSRRSGVDQGHISRIERGIRENPQPLTVLKLSLALGCELEDLYAQRNGHETTQA